MNSPLKCWCTNAAWSNSLFIILLTKFYIENLTEHKFYDMPLSIDISSCIIDWVQRLSIVVSSSLETGSIMFYQIESDLLAVSYDELCWRHLPGPRGQSSQTPDGAGYSQRHLHLTRGQASINLCPWPHKVRKDFLLLSCLTAQVWTPDVWRLWCNSVLRVRCPMRRPQGWDFDVEMKWVL